MADPQQRAVGVAAGESRRGARLVEVCLLDPERGDLIPVAVRRRCFYLLPRYAVPDAVVFRDTLPLLPSGKVGRRALRDLVSG